tara:strand:- start:13119 stop:14057 length:939 start_codon:yes stop_codon:yes gene_type:complete
MDATEQAYLEKRKAARTGQDSNEQPEPVEAVDVLDDSAPIEEVAEAVNEDVTAEIEESATIEETQDEETDLFYYELDGEEVSSDQLREWKSGGLKQADYTRKTQELAESKKTLEADLQKLNSDRAKLSEQLSTLEAMVSEDSLSDEQIAEMREYEPEQYINHIEKQQKRKEFLKGAKSNANPQVDTQAEQAKLIANNPQWLNDGKATEAYQDDMTALNSYYTDNGFTQEQVDAVNTNSLLAQAVIDAARYKATNTRKAVVEKRVRKAPVSTKPRAQTTNAATEKLKALKARAKNGDAKAFAELRQLQRQKGN